MAMTKEEKEQRARQIRSEAATRHGQASIAKGRSSEYTIWLSMRQRCGNPKANGYEKYGGRGIVVCERWDNSFESFFEDMGTRPSPEHSLDRFPNKGGNYEPGNCRWATRYEQSRNTSQTIMVSHAGKTMCLTDWSRITGLSFHTLAYRLKAGWPIEKAMTQPPSHARVR